MGELRTTAAAIYRALRPLAYPRDAIHFLHVGKAAGTQIKNTIKRINATRGIGRIVEHGHEAGLTDLPAGQRYFFCTRDPAARFRSGFYSRKNEGRPTHTVPWTAHERRSFERFAHANDLAEALFTPGEAGRDATMALRSIRHTARNLVDTFKFEGSLFELRPPVWIIRQEQFDADLAAFLDRIGFRGDAGLDTSSAGANRGAYGDAPPLSVAAVANLKRWYAQDYAFLDLCEDWLARQGAGSVGANA